MWPTAHINKLKTNTSAFGHVVTVSKRAFDVAEGPHKSINLQSTSAFGHVVTVSKRASVVAEGRHFFKFKERRPSTSRQTASDVAEGRHVYFLQITSACGHVGRGFCKQRPMWPKADICVFFKVRRPSARRRTGAETTVRCGRRPTHVYSSKYVGTVC